MSRCGESKGASVLQSLNGSFRTFLFCRLLSSLSVLLDHFVAAVSHTPRRFPVCSPRMPDCPANPGRTAFSTNQDRVPNSSFRLTEPSPSMRNRGGAHEDAAPACSPAVCQSFFSPCTMRIGIAPLVHPLAVPDPVAPSILLRTLLPRFRRESLSFGTPAHFLSCGRSCSF